MLHEAEFKVEDAVHFQAYQYDKPLKAIVIDIKKGMHGDGLYRDGTEDKRIYYTLALPTKASMFFNGELNSITAAFTVTTGFSIVESKLFDMISYQISQLSINNPN